MTSLPNGAGERAHTSRAGSVLLGCRHLSIFALLPESLVADLSRVFFVISASPNQKYLCNDAKVILKCL